MPRNHWTLWLDELRPAWLVVFFVALLFVPAAFYYAASQISPSNGLRPPDSVDGSQQGVSLPDAVYFSVITQATLGYGDFQPRGWSRLMAAIQVLLGLVLGGAIVAKITSAPRSRFRKHARKACGVWTDIVMTDSLKAMGVNRIYERDGTLEIDGSNYDIDGTSRGTWHATLVNDRWPVLVFEYSNQYGDMSEFTYGYEAITFFEDETDRVANSFQTKAVDALKGAYAPFDGSRVTDPDIIRALGIGGDQRQQAVRRLLEERLRPKLPPEVGTGA